MTATTWTAAWPISGIATADMRGPADAWWQEKPLSYAEFLSPRPLEQIDLLVLHCTELPDLATAREYGEVIHYPGQGGESGTGNSGHFYIDRDGHCEQWVPLTRVAHHVRGFNERSIGIELVNRGRYPDWFDTRSQAGHEPYPAAQIEALARLISSLCEQLPGLAQIAGHEDLDREQVPASDNPALTVARKTDPGPTFPWASIEAGCSLQRLR